MLEALFLLTGEAGFTFVALCFLVDFDILLLRFAVGGATTTPASSFCCCCPSYCLPPLPSLHLHCQITFLPSAKLADCSIPPPLSNLMLTFSRENLAHAQCSVFHMQRPRFLTNLIQKSTATIYLRRERSKQQPTVRSLAVIKLRLHLDNFLHSTKLADCSISSPPIKVTTSSKIEPSFG